MNYNIKYISGNDEINFSNYPILWDIDHDLFNSSVTYSSISLPTGSGERLQSFSRKAREYKLPIQVLSSHKKSLLNELNYQFDKDIFNKNPGKLYVNDSYIYCFVIGRSPSNFDKFVNYEKIELIILALNPTWITEDIYNFSIYDEITVDGGMSFPFSFPFSFKENQLSKRINNSHYESVNAQITIYGPVIDPALYIGPNYYQVKGELLNSERLIIDPFEKTVNKITASGDVIDWFDKRDKTAGRSVFSPIPIGDNVVSYNGEFSISIKTFTERSEPSWI